MNPPRALPPQSARFSRFLRRGVFLGIGVGILASPVPACLAARAAEPSAAPGTAAPTPSSAPAPDLLLARPGEKKAEALAAFSEGLAAEENADFERALDAYRRSLGFDPGNTDLAVKVALELARRGDVPQGIGVLKDAAKASPKESLPPLCLSQLYGKYLKKPDLAERYALVALRLDPDHFQPYLALFEIYSLGKQTRKAENLLHRALQSSSEDAGFWLDLAKVCLKLPPESASQEKLKSALEKALATAKGNPEIVAKVADTYALAHRLDAAIPLYRKAIAAAKDPRSEPTLALRDKLARSLLADNKREEAIAVLEKMTADAPTRYDTYEVLGELYALDNQLEKATLCYQKALRLDSSQPKSFLRIADLQMRLKKFDDAIKTLSTARAKFPRFPHLTYSLAIVLKEADRFKEALTMFKQAAYEDENSEEGSFTAAFYLDYGVVAEQAGDSDLAVEMLRKSIQLDPANAAQACNYLGYMWVERGEHLEEALNLTKHAVELAPGEAAYLDSLGWCYFKLGDYQNALLYLQKSVEKLDEQEPVIFEHLGDVFAATGKTAEAVANWKKALALDPENKELPKKIAQAGKGSPAPSPSPAPAAPPAP